LATNILNLPLDKTINWNGDPCRICKHSILTHSKYNRSGGLDERCNQRAMYFDYYVGRWAIGRCTCIGYQAPKPVHSELRCTVCGRSINKFHEINKQGIRRCLNCGSVFGDEFRSLDFQKDLRK